MTKKFTIFTICSGLFLGAAAASAATVPNSGISRIFNYCPAPGQFVNVLPVIAEDASDEEVCSAVFKEIGGENPEGMISLGAFGGYVVFGFDHPLVNVPGEYDLKINGNAFVDNTELNGGSCEPGIVMVSADTNGNGLPDDTWYELAGSAYSESRKNFTITYTKPEIPDGSYSYTTNDPERPTGEVTHNFFHKQSYWPEWTGLGTLEFTGTCLPDNAVNTATPPQQYWVLKAFEWGYVDNLTNKNDPGLKLDWAVDADGRPVVLRQVDFIKVYTGICQSCGNIGETSTEVSGAFDLHPDAKPVSGLTEISAGNGRLILMHTDSNGITLRSSTETRYAIYSAAGTLLSEGTLTEGDTHLDTTSLPAGIYIIKAPAQTIKFRR